MEIELTTSSGLFLLTRVDFTQLHPGLDSSVKLVSVLSKVLVNLILEDLGRRRYQLRHRLNELQNNHFIVHSRVFLSLLCAWG